MKRFFVALIILFLISPLVAGCQRNYVPEKRNVVFIIVDTLRADRLGCYGYKRNTSPNIDKFAAGAELFENHHSHSPWTMPSIASIITSLVPRDHGITNWQQPLDEKFLTLAEYLKANGYYTHCIASHTVFKPRFHFDQGYDNYDISVLEKGYPSTVTTSQEISDRAIEALNGMADKPFFLFLHYFDPHNDYLPHAKFDFGKTPSDLYDGEIAFTDHHIGRFLDALFASKFVENTIVIFTADHGEEFHDHGGTKHSKTLYEEVLHTPLIIKAPGIKPAGIRTRVAETDIGPTLLTMLGLPIPANFSGKSFQILKNTLRPMKNRVIFSETKREADKQGIIKGPWKLIHDREKNSWELYHLIKDRMEQQNLFSNNQKVSERLKYDLNAHYEVPRAQVKEEKLPDDILDSLKKLGYL